MRIFLDTNVLASALTTRGLCADLLQVVLAEHELIVGKRVLEELAEVLPRKFGLPTSIVREFLSLLENEGTAVTGMAPANLKLRDRDDEKVVADAVAGAADMFVTGDRELLALKMIGANPVVSPRGLWTTLRK